MNNNDVTFLLYYTIVVLLWMLVTMIIRDYINSASKSSDNISTVNMTVNKYEHHMKNGIVIGTTDWETQCKINDENNENEIIVNSYLHEYVQIGYTTIYKGLCFLKLTEKIQFVKKI